MRQTLLVAAAALAAFGLTAAGSFHFDDYALFSDPSITSPNGWFEVWRPMQSRPLTWFSFWLNYQAGGANPLPFHVVNLLLHVSASVLLLVVLRRFLPSRVAWMAALLFAVHPVQTEAVAYIFARGTLLSTLLCLVSLWLWLEDRAWLATACFGAALLAKEECAAFPLFLLSLALIRMVPRRIIPIVGMLVLSVAAGLRVIYASSLIRLSGAGFGAGVSPFEYLSLQGVAIVRYLKLIVLPWGYSVDPQIAANSVWRIVAWLIVAVAAGCALRWWRAGFWFLAGLLLLAPSSSIFPADDLAADRRLYLPMIAFCVFLALLLQNRRRDAIAVIVAVLTAISIHYSDVWRTEKSLWSEAVAKAPAKLRPRIQLARALPPAEALPVLNDAERNAPADPGVASEQGRVYIELGRPAEALAAFGRALALSPGDALAVNNRGVALQALGQSAAAKADFERALRLKPCLFDARLNLRRLGASPPPANCQFTVDQNQRLRER